MTRKRLALFSLLGVVAIGATAFFALRSRPVQPREAVRSDLDLRDGLLYFHGAKKPFDGLLFEDFSKGHRKLSIDIRGGKVDGVSRGWFDNGQLEVEETLVGGISQGERTRWFATGQKKSVEHIEHGVVTGPYLEWHENGRKAVQMTLHDGHPDGVVEAWYPSGEPKSRCIFANGKMVDRQFFPAPLAAAGSSEVAQP